MDKLAGSDEMSRQPLVSCIIIFLNTEKFLAEAIESVLTQTYPHWELLLVDDGSSDNSTSIAQQHTQQYPDRIHYLEHEHHQNRGMSASRNLGIQHARGTYLAFLDADDVWLAHKLEKQIPILEAQPAAGMVYGALYYWSGWTGDPIDMEKDHAEEIWNFADNTLIQPLEYLTLFIREEILIPSPTCLVVRRDVAVKIGGFEVAFRGLFEDQVFVAKMSLAAPVIVLKDHFEKWRRHEESCTYISENITGEGERMKVVYLDWLETYLSNLGVTDAKLWSALKKAQLPYRHPRLFSLYEKVKQIKDKAMQKLPFR